MYDISLIIDPLQNLKESFIFVFPKILIACLLIIVGYLISFVLGHTVKIALKKVGLDNYIESSKLSKAIGHIRMSSTLGEIFKWWIFIIFLKQSVELVELGALSDLLSSFIMWVPKLFAAIVVIFAGLIFAHFIELKILEHAKVKGTKIVAKCLKGVILFMIVLVAIEQIGINISILKTTFLIIVGAFAAGIALAIGLSFGLGSRKEAELLIRKFRKYF